jgi:hypothetical protein
VLSHLARLDLLREPRPGIDVVVPRAVLDEVMIGEADDPAVSQVPLAIGDWLGVIPTPTVHASIRAGRLDSGEVADDRDGPGIRGLRLSDLIVFSLQLDLAK